MKLNWIPFMLATLLLSLGSIAHEGHHPQKQPTPLLSESVFNLKGEWISQDEKIFSLSDLRGQPAIVAMIYTSCEHACSLIVEDLKKIEKLSAAQMKKPLRLYLFSFDVQRDTPAQLKSYATKRKLDSASWTLLHGDSRSVRELAAVLGLRFKKAANGDFDHSNVITLLNSEGIVEFQQVGLSQDPKDLLEKLWSIQ